MKKYGEHHDVHLADVSPLRSVTLQRSSMFQLARTRLLPGCHERRTYKQFIRTDLSKSADKLLSKISALILIRSTGYSYQR